MNLNFGPLRTKRRIFIIKRRMKNEKGKINW